MRTRLRPLLALCLTAACAPPASWQQVAAELPEALLSVAGRDGRDVWAVGADRGGGPLVLHFDGQAWERRATGTAGHLWWIHAFADGTALLGGERGTILRWDGARFVRQATPGLARQTVFGVWGPSPDEAWAVGSSTNGRRGFVWRLEGGAWREVALPAELLPLRAGEPPGLFKVWGDGRGAVYVVGSDGLALRWREGGWTRLETGTSQTLFTVGGTAEQAFAVGGGATAVLLELQGDAFVPVDAPGGLGLLQGVGAASGQAPVAVGEGGAVLRREAGGWRTVATGLSLGVESLHAAWVDPSGGVWAVGGQVLGELSRGTLVHLGPSLPGYQAPAPVTPPPASCPESQVDPAAGKSAARRWNEQALAAIRRDLPRPTVHARTLFHLSAAMWDAWASFSPTAGQVFHIERSTAAQLESARELAVSHAAHGVLRHRFAKAVGGAVSLACFEALLRRQGGDPADVGTAGDSPRALGNRIARTIIDAHRDDGANEANDYADTTGWRPSGPPLSVEGVLQPVADIDAFQPLDLAVAATQNGIPVQPGVQGYIGAQWGLVRPFALQRPDGGGLYADAGPPPRLDASTMAWVVEVVRKSAELDPTDAVRVDISPGALGNNPLGENSGTGHRLNPATGQPYAPNPALRGDFARVLAEVWADGPRSETPPGHWNVIANQVADHPSFVRRWLGQGEVLPALQWDVRLYLVLNGALHDAAIAAWEVKRAFLCSRPITLVRASALKGQSSDVSQPSYHPGGLPLVPGLIELITEGSSSPGQRHVHLRAYRGEVAVRSWRGEPGDIATTVSGAGWLRGVEWVPYQKRNFVTPAFPGFISGHSTFSRAAAEVLTRATGSAFFPGGLGQQVVPAGTSLTFERGPEQPVVLQWATYFDAADQAGQSRLWGGIHIAPDDFEGRRVGAAVGQAAFARAATYFR